MDKNAYQTDENNLPRFLMQLVTVISRVLVQMAAVLVAEVVVPLPILLSHFLPVAAGYRLC